ncbi:MAG: S1C family serine protease, partial [Caldimonas sp.]
VDRVLDQLLAHGRVQHGYLGIAAQPVRTTLAGDAMDGLLVSSVASGGPAARAGVLVGDVIVKVGDALVTSLGALRDQLQEGTSVHVVASRGGASFECDLQVEQRPASSCG